MAFKTRAELKGSPSLFSTSGCAVCPLRKQRLRHPNMKATGASKPLLYVLGEAPGETEDKDGEQFVGRSGELAREVVPERDVRWNNCLRCRPPRNRAPTETELEACRASVLSDIERSRPKVVLGFGNAAVKFFMGSVDGIMRWRGRIAPVRIGKHVCWFAPTLHPAFILRVQNKPKHRAERLRPADERGSRPRGKMEASGREWAAVFRRDVAAAIAQQYLCSAKGKEPVVLDADWLEQDLTLLEETGKLGARKVRVALKGLKGPLGFDAEMTCLRPYSSGAAVLTFAVSSKDRTVAFTVGHPAGTFRSPERDIVLDALLQCLKRAPRVLAHKADCEMEWMLHLFGDQVLRGIKWACTLQQAYVLDERKGGLGLNFLMRAWMGLKLKEQSGVDRKRLAAVPLERVLRYNAYDAKALLPLDELQSAEIKRRGLEHVYEMQMRRLPTLVAAQRTGLLVDQDCVQRFDKRYKRKLGAVKQKLADQPPVKELRRLQGAPYNPASPDQTVTLLRDIMKQPEGDRRSGVYSTDKTVLARIKSPVATLLRQYRDLAKLHGTYVKNLLPGGGYIYPDGRLHTAYNSAWTATGRLSSEDPNMQNWPVRLHPEIRGQVIAPPGCVLVAVDYGQIEARLIGAVSEDEFLMEALFTDYDIHLEWAKRIAEAYPKAARPFKVKADGWKKMRTDVKSNWVFSGFYLSRMERRAAHYGLPLTIGRRLDQQFWDQFAGVRLWQKRELKFYNEHGYVESPLGRRRRAPLTENMVVNTTIQGWASDVVVDAGCRLSERGEEERKPWMQFVMNIHDDLTFVLPDDDSLDENILTIVKMMLHPGWKCITVPLCVDVKVGYNWHQMLEAGSYRSDQKLEV